MENGTRRLPTLRACTFFRPLCGLIVVPPVTTARNLRLLEGEIRLCKQSQIGSASDLGPPDGRRWLFKKFLEKGKRTLTEEQAANGHQTKREITMRGRCDDHVRPFRVMPLSSEIGYDSFAFMGPHRISPRQGLF